MKHIMLFVLFMSTICTSSAGIAGSKLFVGNLPYATLSEEVGRLVEGFGAVLSVRVDSVDKDGAKSAHATVGFADDEDADEAAAVLDGFIYMGEPLVARSKKPREIIVVGSKVKEVIRDAGLRSDGELVQAVSDKVYELLYEAIKRTDANKRGTVRPYDL